ncbi:probable serine racemase isoform X2 [Mercenaria mercenaria]|uniref:probable serine racemase isoform X2 n=1 Tax=Mercenaria mercenaria TaxID=6596 RepID=UPI00234F8B7A|nr:probable serine racemase isoform X2 [Mercenaria mercenaria]
MPAYTFPVNIDDIKDAHNRIRSHVYRTPVLTSSTFDQEYGAGRKFYFKAENMQKTGSFKARGALNAILMLERTKEHIKGVTTHSSGNHGQALAWAANMKGLKCNVITPKDTPEVKIRSITHYGADVTLCEPTPTSREETCKKVAEENNYDSVPSSDHYHIIAGQGTIALEFLEDVPQLNAILVSASKGGMASGVAIAAKALKPDIKIFIVEPDEKELEKCLRAAMRLWPDPPRFVDTIADGIRIQQLGNLTWPIILNLAEKEVLTALAFGDSDDQSISEQ